MYSSYLLKVSISCHFVYRLYLFIVSISYNFFVYRLYLPIFSISVLALYSDILPWFIMISPHTRIDYLQLIYSYPRLTGFKTRKQLGLRFFGASLLNAFASVRACLKALQRWRASIRNLIACCDKVTRPFLVSSHLQTSG